MQYYPFDSKNKLYKPHFGAVASDQKQKLRLLLHKDALCSAAFLLIKCDDEPDFKEVKLSPAEWLEDYQFFDCEIALDSGLYWYRFKYRSPYGEFYVTRCENSLGHVSDQGQCWQQTVYDNTFKTPDWLEGGVIYQIFPDRFFNSGSKKSNIPNNRFINNDWNKQPEYRQVAEKCTLGNDFYGGDIKGIIKKLPHIAELGVNCIYLNPIFEASSNHRYNTADYFKIDPLLGTEADLINLCKAAKKLGIAVILDGVFSHTGDDSVYFNKYQTYNSVGAFNSKKSPYYNWFKFNNWPHDYESWWGIKTLPETIEDSPEFTNFITGENGVLRYWLKKGISGWRLDVADELPDKFLENIRLAVKSENPNAYILGEVWEDASNKISYGARRKFLQGKQLDSVMNYPFCNAIIDFIFSGNANAFVNTVESICENYPPQSIKTLMNHIGTHDTARILTLLGFGKNHPTDREWQSKNALCQEQYEKAKKLLKIVTAIQFTLPGVPSVYYGDEAGIQGFGDPFCRAAFPWDNQDNEILEHYKALGKMRKDAKCFKEANFEPYVCCNNLLTFVRSSDQDAVLAAFNINGTEVNIDLPDEFLNCSNVLLGTEPNKQGTLCLPPLSFSVIKLKKHKKQGN